MFNAKFDSLERLIEKNSDISYVDYKLVNKNISNVLEVDENRIKDYTRLDGGYTNPVFTFKVKDEKYVYRYPGKGTDNFINRQSEKQAHTIARDMGIDDTLLWIDNDGHKISKYINDFRYFDYYNDEDVQEVVKMLRVIHDSNELCGIKYDVKSDIENFWRTDASGNIERFADIENIKDQVYEIYDSLDYEHADLVLCHNDVYTTNILVADDKFNLIDWEFAKDGHRAFDLCTFFVCSDYGLIEIESILEDYLESKDENLKIEYFEYFVVGTFYWLLWALHVELNGGDTEGFVDRYYSYLQMFIKRLNI